MNSSGRTRKPWLLKAALASAGLLTVLVVAALAFKLTGHSLGIRSWISSITSPIKAVLYSRSVESYQKGDYSDIIFLHHSVGHNLIEQGGVREAFTREGFSFWDQDYNYLGLTGPTGQSTGYGYNVPGDNTDVDGLAGIFAQKVYPIPINTLSGLLQHEVIILKSCFPNSDIIDETQLAQDKAYYLNMRDTMDKHPDKVFIILTSPPLNPAETDPEIAARARALADWLNSDEFLKGHSNIFTFDFFSLLAGDNPALSDYNMLRQEYQSGADSHPNPLANETIGPLFVQFVIRSARSAGSQ